MNIQTMSVAKCIYFLFGIMALPLSAQAAGFDCAKANTKVEHIICENPEISKLDDELSQNYRAVLQDKTQADAIKQAQKQWMKGRDGCLDAECVRLRYVYRNLQLISMSHMTEIQEKRLHELEFERDKYVISSGKGNALCEMLLQRMNEELRRHPHGPICAYDALKAIPGVTFPNWKKLPLKENGLTYKRFLLSKMVYSKHYPEIFGSSGKAAGEFNMPTMSQYVGADPYSPDAQPGVPIGQKYLDDIFDVAVDRGNELYLWKGVFPPPNDTDVLLVEMSRYHKAYSQEGCPNYRLTRFSADLLTPKPWLQTYRQENPKWELGYDSLHFIFDGQFFQLHEYLSEAPQLSNGFQLHTIQKFSQCSVSGNFYFPADPEAH